MKKIFRINFIIFLLLLISENSFAESKLGEIKDKIKTGEDKLIDIKIFFIYFFS